MNLIFVDASNQFIRKFKNVSDPAKKSINEKIIKRANSKDSRKKIWCYEY